MAFDGSCDVNLLYSEAVTWERPVFVIGVNRE